MRRLMVSLTVLSFGLLAGCGDTDASDATTTDTAAGAGPAAATTDPDSAQVKAENMIADCMKKKGFQYVPHPLDFGDNSPQAKYAGMTSVLQPADEVKAFRAKYGFGGYSRLVYPNDPAVAAPAVDPAKNPNNAIRAGLDPSRQAAYDVALEGSAKKAKAGTEQGAAKGDQGCAGEAAAKYYGSGPSNDKKASAGREYAKFQNDAAMIAAAQKYASCLKAKGYRVTSAQPGMIEQSQFTAAIDAFTQAGQIDAAAAKSALDTEIKAALDDLECRTDYATLARTKWASVITTGNGIG
ncbi:hypothetical protein Acy02nite_86600 [Actinoplanes cyaneus]|uniref:Uncharacterized protein n=1 Tax=Actinoplanes cyaneus TaxID=52696 RepID=A0A919IS62_9ACTN|nr:hypothetical protein [Actinoplanes cyaneus]MCW2144088.1 hypothetical protein [Actinoplanes cyaneus]GID70779.1 hypothetical protein Acy02nite_86600 [Actinoplanes cyaneus]